MKMVMCGLLMSFVACSAASASEVAAYIDDDHVLRWNRFADAVYAMHVRALAGRTIRQEASDGRYGGVLGKKHRYRDIEYVDASSGRLLSRIRWDDHGTQKTWHVAEVYVHDREGRIERDYVAMYLPWARNAPIRTYISLHNHHNGLHAFRQFDASGELLYEQCRGKLDGKDVDLSLEPYRITDPLTRTTAYRACFSGLPASAGEDLMPR